MDTVWLLLGVVVLGATLLDVFLTALGFGGSGPLSELAMRLQWRALRRVTRRLPRSWRPMALRQVTGAQVVAVVLLWVGGTTLGYALVYLGLMTPTSFTVAGPGPGRDLLGALYLSAAQLTTVGGASLTPQTDALRLLTVAESLTGALLLVLLVTFLLRLYAVTGRLSRLCAQFVTAERGAGTPVASVARYFRDGRPHGLDRHVQAVGDGFSAYTDGVRLHHVAYYVQSGRDRFALPYALRMVGGTIGALRWGLPTGHPGADLPGLSSLTYAFLEFGDQLQARLRWTSADVPAVVDAARFARIARGQARGDEHDGWAARFVRLDHDMAELAAVEPIADLDDTYRRYAQWLPFAYRAQQIATAVGRDLDYQPVIVPDHRFAEPAPGGADAPRDVEQYVTTPVPQPRTDGAPPTGRLSRWRTFVDDHVAQVDPGRARLRSASRALLAAVVAGGAGALVVRALGGDGPGAAVFGAFVAMLSTGIAVDKTLRGRRVTSVLLVVPAVLVVVLGALAAGSPTWTAVLAVGIAVVGAWVGRFGPRWAALGRVTFMVYYFALLQRLRLPEVELYVATAVLGVAAGFLLNYVVLPERPVRVLRSAIVGFGRELVTSVDTLVDAASWARWDPDVRARVEVDQHRLERGATFLAGQLTGEPDATGVDPVRGVALRLRIFDTTLAAAHLTGAVRDVTGTAVSLELRGRLAGRLELLRAQLAGFSPGPGAPGAAPGPWDPTGPPAAWPRAARALHHATNELYRARTALAAAEVAPLDPAAVDPATPRRADLDDEADDARALDELAWNDAGSRQPTGGVPPASRRAVQAGVAVAAALGVGEAVSSTHQYWAMLPAYQVLGGTDGETVVKGAQRVAGTVAGAVVGFAIAIAAGGEAWVLVPLLALAVFASTYFRPVSPAVATVWTTMMFAVIYEFLGRLTPVALGLRVVETLLGAAAALLVARFVLPVRTRSALAADASTLVRDVAVVLSAVLARLDGSASVPARSVQDQLLVVERDARAVSSTAAPLRRSAGAAGAGGIERRLTALWSLTYDTRHLVRAVGRAVDSADADAVDLSAPDWRAVRATLDANVSALLDVLAGRLPPAVEPDLPVALPDDGGSPQAAVLRRLTRINETLVVLVGQISPGAVQQRVAPGRVE